VPLINARFEQRRLRQQRLDARLSELREILDIAVQHLFKAYSILFDIREECRKPLSPPERLRALGNGLREEVDLLAGYGLRVRLRTPAGAAVAERQDEANRIFLRYEAEYRAYLEDRLLARGERPPPPPAEDAFAAITSLIREIRTFAGVVTPHDMALRS
jgi:hypothetical protein